MLAGGERLGEAPDERGARGHNLLQHAAPGAAGRAARELFGRRIPEDHMQRAVDGDDGVGETGEDRFVVHAARARSGIAFMPSGARSPARSRSVPAAAIIAALSVQRRGGGMGRGGPCSAAAALRWARRGPLAATPPVTTRRLTPKCRAARTVRRTSILTTAAWNEAATSAI